MNYEMISTDRSLVSRLEKQSKTNDEYSWLW